MYLTQFTPHGRPASRRSAPPRRSAYVRPTRRKRPCIWKPHEDYTEQSKPPPATDEDLQPPRCPRLPVVGAPLGHQLGSDTWVPPSPDGPKGDTG
eukprot:366245-Chlamydomonas_euryale.AAC.41